MLWILCAILAFAGFKTRDGIAVVLAIIIAIWFMVILPAL